MYLGVTSHHSAKRVSSYAMAEAALAAASLTPTGRKRAAKPDGFPLGGHSKSVTWVHQNDDGSIAFQLYDTDVVTWQADGSVLVDNYGTVTTSGFASRFLPGGISLRHPTETRGNSGGSKAIAYHAAARPAPNDDWDTHKGELNAYWATQHLCQGAVVRFVEQGDHWAPDETTLDPMKFIELDTKASREMAREHHLKDFRTWLEVAPAHLDLEHEGTDIDGCMAALKVRDFRTAAVLLPVMTIPNGWGAADRIRPLNIPVQHRDQAITMGSVDKLRLGMLDAEGLTTEVSLLTVSVKQYDRYMATVRRLDSMNCISAYQYGASA